MPMMTWTDRLSVGVAVLDQDHKRLVGTLNALYDAMRAGHGRDVLGRILDDLIAYTKEHFSREEALFDRTGYPAGATHRQQHAALTRRVLEVQQKYAAGLSATLSIDVLRFLEDWLVQHIQGSDQKYRAHLNANGIH